MAAGNQAEEEQMETNTAPKGTRVALAAVVAAVVIGGIVFSFGGRAGAPDDTLPGDQQTVGTSNLSEDDVNAAGTRLLAAVRAGDIEAAQGFLDEGDSPNQPGSDGSTPLNAAIALGNTEMALLLIDRGADPNTPTPDGYFPIHQAVINSDMGSMSQLAAKGADVNARVQASGQTALMLAASANRLDMVAVLTGWGADATLIDAGGDNVLHLAIRAGAGDTEMYSILRAAGADPNSVGSQGRTAIELATDAGLSDVVAVLQG